MAAEHFVASNQLSFYRPQVHTPSNFTYFKGISQHQSVLQYFNRHIRLDWRTHHWKDQQTVGALDRNYLYFWLRFRFQFRLWIHPVYSTKSCTRNLRQSHISHPKRAGTRLLPSTKKYVCFKYNIHWNLAGLFVAISGSQSNWSDGLEAPFSDCWSLFCHCWTNNICKC